MDSLDFKTEKAKAIKNHQQRQKIGSVFRLLEVFIVVVLISKFTVHLTISVKFCTDYFKDLSLALVSPTYVFVLGNVIIFILLIRSTRISPQESSLSGSKTDLYEEFLGGSDRGQGVHRDENGEKQSTLEVKEEDVVTRQTHNFAQEFRQYRRIQSEKSSTLNRCKLYKELRRTVTEKGENLVKKSYPEDHMGNEEFRQTVEAFIARKRMFVREEEHDHVL